MADIVIMPKQGLQMTEGTIIRWLKQEGETIKAGEPLFEMETDKLTITIDSSFDGTLLKILHGENDVVPITEPIAVIGAPGEDISAVLPSDGVKKESEAVPEEKTAAPSAAAETSPLVRAPGERIFITPRARKTASERSVDYTEIPGSGYHGIIIERDILNAPVQQAVKATPVAKRIAELEGVDLTTVSGSGQGGKIMKADVLNAVSPSDSASVSAAGAQNETIVPITGMRRAIYENMMKSLHESAQANHRMKVDMSEAKRLRESLKKADVKVGYTDILSLAVTRALMAFPRINAEIRDGSIVEKHYVNLGIAVAIDNGLIVPNIKNCQRLSLTEIAAQIKEKAAAARSGKLTREDYSGGTFTITNLGMYDIDEFTAVINPPESAILAVGKIAETPVVMDGQIVIRPMMTLSLTYDHRIIDGAPAAEFLQYVKKLLQNPYLML